MCSPGSTGTPVQFSAAPLQLAQVVAIGEIFRFIDSRSDALAAWAQAQISGNDPKWAFRAILDATRGRKRPRSGTPFSLDLSNWRFGLSGVSLNFRIVDIAQIKHLRLDEHWKRVCAIRALEDPTRSISPFL
jgi:hypothetical protein